MYARSAFPVGIMVALCGCSASKAACDPPRQAANSAVKLYDINPDTGPSTPPTAVTVFGDNFSQDTKVYFDGLMARETLFRDESHLEALTPYMRPGQHQVLVKSKDSEAVRLETPFTATPAPVDLRIDAALSIAREGKVSAALSALDDIAKNDSDYQVRAFAHYQEGELYFAQGDWQRWLGETMGIYLNAKLAGPSVQTYWPYGVANARACFLLNRSGGPEVDALNYDMAVQWDATGATEPHFRRAIFRARSGKLKDATEDIQFCLRAEPGNPAYLALAAFNATQVGDKSASAKLYQRARAIVSRQIHPDSEALALLGEALYAAGNSRRAQLYWAEAGSTYPLAPSLALLQAKKHLWRAEQETAAMLLSETVAMSPSSAEADEARGLLAGVPSKP